jgi:hypothetical protein
VALNEYQVTVNGVTTNMLLNDEDAKTNPNAVQFSDIHKVGPVDPRMTASEARQAKADTEPETKTDVEPETKRASAPKNK